ncbi:MAG: DNA repair protein RecN [Oxalobacter sp.]|nr:MAG: DNA repair protein RecN [Oxalobacter sp.]
MLRTLSIRDFVIVDTLDLDFGGGFSVLTGETGAGKSILIDALALALGGRGEATVIRENAARADISAEFQSNEAIEVWLKTNDFPREEGVVMLRRVIDSAGRSRAFINGIVSTVTQLRELGEMLVDIHGQHAHQSLMKAESQRELLDNHAGLSADAEKVANAYRTWQALIRQCHEFEANAKSAMAERERLEWQVSELEKLAPKEGEWIAITQEHSRLSHAASLTTGAQEAISVLAESDQPLLSQLFLLQQRLSRLADVDDRLNPLLELLESARIQLQEAASTLNTYLSRVDLDPKRLQLVEDRMDAMHSAARKFRVPPEELHLALAALSAQLAQLTESGNLEALRERKAQAEAAYRKLAQALSQQRAKAAKALGGAVTAAMQELSMIGGSFAVELHPCDPASYGLEQVEFLVAGHAGTSLRPLSKTASGGELARIALAISVIASSATTTPTLIFDEVDSGIGGGVAEVVGRLLKRLGDARQVLCVTHLPQVASQAAQHFQVSKKEKSGKPVSRIDLLDTSERIEEIARMLGGLEITATTRKHAKEMLAI